MNENNAVFINPDKVRSKKGYSDTQQQLEQAQKVLTSGIFDDDIFCNDLIDTLFNDNIILDKFTNHEKLGAVIRDNITSDTDVALFGDISNDRRSTLLDYVVTNNEKYDMAQRSLTVRRARLLYNLYHAYLAMNKKYTDTVSRNILSRLSARLDKAIVSVDKDLKEYKINIKDYLS